MAVDDFDKALEELGPPNRSNFFTWCGRHREIIMDLVKDQLAKIGHEKPAYFRHTSDPTKEMLLHLDPSTRKWRLTVFVDRKPWSHHYMNSHADGVGSALGKFPIPIGSTNFRAAPIEDLQHIQQRSIA